jgi:Glyoxalase-like domain
MNHGRDGRGLSICQYSPWPSLPQLSRRHSPPKEPVRVHVDLYTREQSRQVDRLVVLGATRVEDWPYPQDADFIVLRDPDGNEFCVIDHDPVQS